MTRSHFRSKFLVGRVAVVIVGAVVWFGCAPDQRDLTAPSNQRPSFSLSSGQQQDLGPALAVHRRHSDPLLTVPGVVGTAVGLTADGRPAVKIFTRAAGVAGLPQSLEGIPVVVEVTGEFFAKPCDRSTCTNTDVWPLPVPIGVSTGSDAFIFVAPYYYCVAGTIGARLKNAAGVYALSNNHVYALENTAPLFTNVLQPGLADTQCSSTGSNIIGVLSDFAPIQFCAGSTCPDNTIDAAIASSDIGKLGQSTPPAGYGTPSSNPVPAFVGQNVQKYGRTTSLTTGRVDGIDATVDVGYSTGTARFVHQIIVGRCPITCIGSGDSGSLLVTNDLSANPVGLLFAGTSDGTLAIANRIGDVLTRFSVSVDGWTGTQPPPPPPPPPPPGDETGNHGNH